MLAEGQTTVQYYAKILYGILSCEMFLRIEECQSRD